MSNDFKKTYLEIQRLGHEYAFENLPELEEQLKEYQTLCRMKAELLHENLLTNEEVNSIVKNQEIVQRLKTVYEEYVKERNEDCQKFKHNDNGVYCDCGYCTNGKELKSILENKK